jgi:hypothetical protein
VEVGVGDIARAWQAGEMVRAAVQDLGMPHATSGYQSVGVGCDENGGVSKALTPAPWCDQNFAANPAL